MAVSLVTKSLWIGRPPSQEMLYAKEVMPRKYNRPEKHTLCLNKKAGDR
jgi:hypothetical protein